VSDLLPRYGNLGQDLMVKTAKKIIVFLFGLLELKMTNLKCFFEKSDLRPLGVNSKHPC
jgi:hypothetical protein